MGFNAPVFIRCYPSCGFKQKQDTNMQHKLLFTFDRQGMVKFLMQELEVSAFSRYNFLFDIFKSVFKLN